jgi:hypothetical protein
MKACYRKATCSDTFLKPHYSSQNMFELKFTLLHITSSNTSDTADDNVIRHAGYSLTVVLKSLTLEIFPLKRLSM